MCRVQRYPCQVVSVNPDARARNKGREGKKREYMLDSWEVEKLNMIYTYIEILDEKIPMSIAVI